MKNIIIDEKFIGIRFNKYLLKLLVNANSGFIYKMLRKKNILLNEKRANGTEILKDGDKVSIFFKEETYKKFTENNIKNCDKIIVPLDLMKKIKDNIIYEDENILVLDKWDGIPSQNSEKFSYSIDMLIKQYLIDKGVNDYSGIVNRIDTNTKGLIIFAKNYLIKRELTLQFVNSLVDKKYIALVRGIVDKNDKLSLYMKKNTNTNIVNVLNEDAFSNLKNKKGYYLTRTEYEVLDYIDDNTKICVNIKTGKPHQIRAALSFVKHPIVGDRKYGGGEGSLKLISKYLKFNNISNEKFEYLNELEFFSRYEL